MADEGEPPSLPAAVGGPAEVSQLAAYLSRVVPALLESDEDVPEMVTLQAILKDNTAKLKRFIEDSQEHTLTIHYILPPEVDPSQGEMPSLSQQAYFEVSLGANYRPVRSVGVIFTKRFSIIECDKSIRSQLRFLSLPEDSPFETLHGYVQDAINPLFNSFVQHSKKEERYM